jgi:hypothetical protein
MYTSRFLIWISLICMLAVFTTNCATERKKITVGATALLLEDIAKSAYKQTDTRVIREGMPAYLMLMDGMVEAWPDNDRLLMSAAQGYATFAGAFIDNQDKAYANLLYGRAKDYALRSLEQRGLKDPASRPFDDFEAAVNDLEKPDVPFMFWAAACWGNWIQLNMESMEAMAELPRVEVLMRRALMLDEAYYYGGPHLFMGLWFGSRPKMAGGDLNLARKHFLKAIELGEGKFLMAYIYYAEYYAKKVFDKELYISILENVHKTPAGIVPELTLLNTIAHKRATQLMQEADEYF